MPAHDEREQDRKGSPILGCLIVAALMLPVYVLSLGPFIWLANRRWLPTEAGIIYAPLGLLAWCEPIKRLLNWYVELWQ